LPVGKKVTAAKADIEEAYDVRLPFWLCSFPLPSLLPFVIVRPSSFRVVELTKSIPLPLTSRLALSHL
jgi:hypothetical protein